MATMILTVLGVVVIAVGLYDMFQTLLRPRGSGPLSGAVMKLLWRTSRRLGHPLGSSIGPLAMVLVIVLWVALQGAGWALVYLPHVPDGFSYSPGIDPSRYHAVAEAFYISLVTLATVGFGDVVAVHPWLRLAAPLQGLIGFALITAALTWFTQVYPPLARRHDLAVRLKSLADAGWDQALPGLDGVAAARVLDQVATDVSRAGVDLMAHSESYYFQEQEPDLSLARHLPYARQLVRVGESSPSAETRAAAAVLGQALDQLAARLRQNVLSAGPDTTEVFDAYARTTGVVGPGEGRPEAARWSRQ